jgi:hypothetical protein
MKVWARLFAAVLATAALAGCASHYGPDQITGGYLEKELEPGTWRVQFLGNGYTTSETTQTFWLYRCAELAKSKGYDGFRILTPIRLSEVQALRPTAGAPATIIKVHGHGGGGGHYTYYSYSYSQMPKPSLSGDIQMIRNPIAAEPGKVFDATALMAALDPYVKGKLCGTNVCPHVHRYLYPVPPADPGAPPVAPPPPVAAPARPAATPS